MWPRSSMTTSVPGRVWSLTAIWFAIEPVGVKSAASFSKISAARSCRRLTLGSSPYTSSPTSASAIARRMAGVGRVTVSLRRSICFMKYRWQRPASAVEGDPLRVAEADVDGSRAAEDVDQHLEARRLLQDLRHLAGEGGERPRLDAHGVALRVIFAAGFAARGGGAPRLFGFNDALVRRPGHRVGVGPEAAQEFYEEAALVLRQRDEQVAGPE